MDDIIDIDETLLCAKEFESRYAWSYVGGPAYGVQLVIDGNAYSTIAAYTPMGFIAWSIYEGSVTALEFNHFLNVHLQNKVADNGVVLVDNARIHKTTASKTKLEEVTGGRYAFVPAYSPDFKPIELGFANIKQFLRKHEYEAVVSPVLWIDKAFQHYSQYGDGSGAGKGLMYYITIFKLIQPYFIVCFF